jgi:hypothetical protein
LKGDDRILFSYAKETTHANDERVNSAGLIDQNILDLSDLLSFPLNTSCLYRSATVTAFCGMAV